LQDGIVEQKVAWGKWGFGDKSQSCDGHWWLSIVVMVVMVILVVKGCHCCHCCHWL